MKYSRIYEIAIKPNEAISTKVNVIATYSINGEIIPDSIAINTKKCPKYKVLNN